VPAAGEEQRFAAILRYWKERVSAKSIRPGAYIMDGPDGNRIHVPVPDACAEFYEPAFSVPFLLDRMRANDVMIRKIAQDLLELRHERLFSYSSRGLFGRVSAPGETPEGGIDCTVVVVQGEPIKTR
jgi:hypothetical protein